MLDPKDHTEDLGLEPDYPIVAAPFPLGNQDQSPQPVLCLLIQRPEEPKWLGGSLNFQFIGAIVSSDRNLPSLEAKDQQSIRLWEQEVNILVVNHQE